MFRVVNTVRLVANSQPVRLSVRCLISRGQARTNPSDLLKTAARHNTWSNKNYISIENGGRKGGSINIEKVKEFHTSQSRKALPPIFLLLMKPIGKFLAVIFGRTFRKWWRSLPPQKKQKFLQKVKENRMKLYASAALGSACLGIFYVTHLEVDPLTGRSKFIVFNNDQLLKLAQVELDMQVQLFQAKFLPHKHPAFQRVVCVANRLLASNKDLEQVQNRTWHITVVDEPNLRNAFVLPTGHIFIFTGMLNECSNDDQLCVVLAHEISHVLLNHQAEQLSHLSLIDILLEIPIAIIWAILPDAAALLSHWLSDNLTKLMFHLPFSRTLESEADQIGLQLAARACYDVREASVFWAKMGMNEGEVFEWLSTHPSSETRQVTLDALMPHAMKMQEECKCPKLPALDPRLFIPKKLQMAS